MTIFCVEASPQLPIPRGPVSAVVIGLLKECAPHRHHLEHIEAPLRNSDPFCADIQLALHVCYELHYRGFSGVAPAWEWNAGLLHLRSRLEENFQWALRHEIGSAKGTAKAELERLPTEGVDGAGPNRHLCDRGTWLQMREYFAHRSISHLKEGDPHAWLVGRLRSQAKAPTVSVEFDEFSPGSRSRAHRQMFADLMASAGLNSTYLGYLDAVPAESLAVVNLMSLFGLHRELRGAAVGHLAATELTSSPRSHRMVTALRRMHAPAACVKFYREHVEADAVHEQVVRHDAVESLLCHEPELAADVVFGIRAWEFVEERLATWMTNRWTTERSSLLRPL